MFINDVTQHETLDPLPVVSLFRRKQHTLDPLPPKAVTSFIDDCYKIIQSPKKPSRKE